MTGAVGGNVANKFRQTFRVVQKDALHWFPGHMSRGLKQMQQRLKTVDCIIEVHDARVPISGRCHEFNHTITGLKPHIFVLNKKDLADQNYNDKIIEKLNFEGISNVLFTNFTKDTDPGMKKILPLAKKLIEESNRYNRTFEPEFSIMIIGVPNVGKSSLINRLRNVHLGKSNATHVGAVAGITRSVLTRIKISEKPSVYVLDTPGILTPRVSNVYDGLKLALVGCLQDHLVGEETIADYLLFWLNKHERFEYVKVLGLPEPKDNILEVLSMIAAKLGRAKKIKNFDGKYVMKLDLVSAAEYFIRLFRTGQFGHFCLDIDQLKSNDEEMELM
ncbi:mitochondrial GTPase 1 [Cephus cinctus]|uniref:Mitochondrial GTPase 1 n=1 Tax=Cephus cinctus TaxID=211228 RepID=A0AAJ7FIN3_CEPCN|nr:mitochondrial GTPase 1 [Cephus cinctus]